MAGTSRLASSQNVVDSCFISGGITASEGFLRCWSLAFRGCFVSGSTDLSLCGEILYNAGAPMGGCEAYRRIRM